MKMILRIMLGSWLLVLLAQWAFPLSFTPVPVTLQTFGVALLAMTLGAKEAPCAVILYLIQAALGLPVLQHGQSNANWLLTPLGGYLLGFVFSSYLISKLLACYRPRTLLHAWLIFSANEGSVLIIGSLWLSYFIGWENSILKGVLPFIPGALIKISAASACYFLVGNLKRRYA